MLGSALDCIISIDHEGMVVEWNPAAESTFGYTRREALGKEMAELIVPPSLREQHRRGLAHYLGTGEGPAIGKRIELTGMRKDGSEFPVEVSITRVDLPGPPLFTGFVRDITRSKEREEDLRRHARRLELLRSIDLAILAAQSTEELIGTALSRVRDLIPCRRATVGLFDFRAEEMVVFATTLIDETSFPSGTRIPLEGLGGLGGRIIEDLRQGRVSLVEDLATLADLPPVFEAARAEGVRSVLAAPLRVEGELIGVLNLSSEAPRAFDPAGADVALEVANQLAIAVRQARLRESAEQELEQRKHAEEELRENLEVLERTDKERRRLLARLVTVQEEEREQVAADIHDDSIQVMTAAAMRLDMLRARITDPEDAEAVVKLERTVREAITRLRNLIFDLHPVALEREGLAAALRDCLERVKQETGLDYGLEDRLHGDPSSEIRTTAYRIAQEALGNTKKHARAGRVDVLLASMDNGMLVRIADDGIGFTSEHDNQPLPGHLGLPAMRERALLAGGWLKVESSQGAGTTVSLWLPVRPDGTAGSP